MASLLRLPPLTGNAKSRHPAKNHLRKESRSLLVPLGNTGRILFSGQASRILLDGQHLPLKLVLMKDKHFLRIHCCNASYHPPNKLPHHHCNILSSPSTSEKTQMHFL
ncbi:hypothetical protein I7I53_00277 [Histoplasma capsulatum var. duboisii H88]|uniref:Uncharacterized protein n=1 Tax=Ajellomyces capsulatus (strain H88) TaxID=544711 RepID=A0A8A1LKX6_AJEC8|nr:hypothetical protein I7I53_00277 [Histoplasma capsulatum var. duboisii H88]